MNRFVLGLLLSVMAWANLRAGFEQVPTGYPYLLMTRYEKYINKYKLSYAHMNFQRVNLAYICTATVSSEKRTSRRLERRVFVAEDLAIKSQFSFRWLNLSWMLPKP